MYNNPAGRELNALYANHERGHTRITGAAHSLGRGAPVIPENPSTELFHRDSWRGHGPFAEMARSAMLESGQKAVGRVRGAVNFDEQIYSSESRVNLNQGITVRVKPLKPGVPGIERGQLGFLKKHDPTEIGNGLDCDNHGGVPLVILAPRAWQAYMHKKQRLLWYQDREAYMRQTPQQYMEDWVLYGVMGADDLPQGHVVDRPRVCTMLVKNEAPCKTYWRRARPGSRAYMVIKKHRNGPKFEMIEAPEQPGPGIGGLAYGYGGDNEEEAEERVEAMQQSVPINPFSIGFYATTQGEQLPHDVFHYVDEDGFEHWDALVIEVGTVQATPVGAAYNSAVPQEQECEPYCEEMERQRIDEYTAMKLLLDLKHNL
jgi:hypothetical protein